MQRLMIQSLITALFVLLEGPVGRAIVFKLTSEVREMAVRTDNPLDDMVLVPLCDKIDKMMREED